MSADGETIDYRRAETRADFDLARLMIQEYADWLGVDLGFQKFDEELAALESMYVPPDGRFFIASRGGEAAGCIGLRALPTPGDGEMKRLYVRSGFRGYGIGRALVERTMAAAREIGYRLLLFDTWPPRMPEAQALYESYGCEEIPPYYDNPVPGVVFRQIVLD